MRVVRPGEGTLPCQHPPGCGNREIDGLEFCLRHMPDDRLEEAEQAAGWRRCRWHHGEPDGCHAAAVKGTSPPRCKTHGANLGGVVSKQAAGRVVDGRVTDRMAAIMGEHGDRLLNPPPVGNPLTELLDLAAEMAEWKAILRDIVSYLFSQQRIRSSHQRVGEELRAEVLLFERAQERYAQILINITRLGIEARLAQIEEAQVKMVDGALAAALAAATTGLPDGLVRQEKARQVLRRELTKAAKAG